MSFDDYKVTVPCGASGGWKIDQFTINADKSNLSRYQDGMRYLRPGTYTRLCFHDIVVMSDTHAEIRDHVPFINGAWGNVLVAGLGIGVVLQGLLRKDNVLHVTVVEKSEHVINLVESHYRKMFGNRFTVEHADIFEWKPPKCSRYDCAWYDIWSTICMDNLPEITHLKRRFGRRVEQQAAWQEGYLRKRNKREKREKRERARGGAMTWIRWI